MRETVTALENDDRVKVVVFESAVDGFFLNHSDFLANIEDLPRLRKPCATRCRAGQFRQRTRNPDRLVRQVGDRQHQAARQRSQPASRRRNQSRLGRLHGRRQATSGAGKNQSPPGARPAGAWRPGKSTRILVGQMAAQHRVA
jgi:hypothetical protein